jgi:trehalose-6-phosphate synthase
MCEAHEIVFGKHRPVRLGKLTYLQITPTNRAEIPEYSDLQEDSAEASSQIPWIFVLF